MHSTYTVLDAVGETSVDLVCVVCTPKAASADSPRWCCPV